MKIAEHEFADAARKVGALVTGKYGVAIGRGPVKDGNTGDFNGLEITLNETLDEEMALFVLLHLFGHTVQWCISDELRQLGQDLSGTPDPAKLARIEIYENDASRYGLALLCEAGLENYAPWLADWCAADWQWLKHFYTTSEKAPYRSTFRAGSPMLRPLPIPPFKPQRFESRWAF